MKKVIKKKVKKKTVPEITKVSYIAVDRKTGERREISSLCLFLGEITGVWLYRKDKKGEADRNQVPQFYTLESYIITERKEEE